MAASGDSSPPAETPAAPLHGTTAGIAWLEIVTGGARPSDPLPMIVGLHGLGGGPSEFMKVFDGFSGRARIVLAQGILPFRDGFAWFSPSDLDSEETAKGITAAADRLAVALVALAKERPTIGAPLLTGFSQGGAMTFAVAAHHPEVIAAAYPLSGWLPPSLRPPTTASARPSLLALHGTGDERVPIEESKETVARLVAAGYHAELHEYPGMPHTVGSAERRELYQALQASIDATHK